MATYFPANPTLNDVYQPEGSSTQYIWTGTYWAVQNNTRPLFDGSASGSIVTIDGEGYVKPSSVVIINNVLQTTASLATTASYTISSSWAQTSSFTQTASFAQTASAVNQLRQDTVWITNKLRLGTTKAPWGTGSVTLGFNNEVSGSYSIAMGSNNFVSESAPYSTIAGGQYNIASAAFQTVVGQFNATSSRQSGLIIGAGDELGRRNVAEFYQDNIILSGSVRISGSLHATASFANTIVGTTGSAFWIWNMGTPANHGWTLGGNAFYSASANDGLVLTPAIDAQQGTVSRTLSTSYFADNDLMFTVNAKAGLGTGADGIAFYIGAAGTGASSYDGITVFIDEFNSTAGAHDSIKVYKNTSLIVNINPTTYLDGALDSNRFRKWSMVVSGPSSNRTVTVLVDDVMLWRGSVGAWTPSGANVGLWGFTGGLNNQHCVTMMNLHPAKMWMMSNGLL